MLLDAGGVAFQYAHVSEGVLQQVVHQWCNDFLPCSRQCSESCKQTVHLCYRTERFYLMQPCILDLCKP